MSGPSGALSRAHLEDLSQARSRWAGPRARWRAFLAKPETLLRWHREASRRRSSFHDKDARPIRKDHIGVPVEFGYKAHTAVPTPMPRSGNWASAK